MGVRRLALMVVLAAFGVALVPSAATADDASVWTAFNSHEAEFDQAGANYRRAVRAARRAGRDVTESHLRAIIDADRQINAVLATITNEVKAQPPSTPAGERAKRFALRGLILFQRANDLEIASYEHLIAGRVRASDVAFKRALRTVRRSARYMRLAVRAFDKLGFERGRSQPRAVGF
jgi:hypothetical protein